MTARAMAIAIQLSNRSQSDGLEGMPAYPAAAVHARTGARATAKVYLAMDLRHDPPVARCQPLRPGAGLPRGGSLAKSGPIAEHVRLVGAAPVGETLHRIGALGQMCGFGTSVVIAETTRSPSTAASALER